MADDAKVRFTDEGDGVVMCQPGQASDSSVYSEFRESFKINSSQEFTDESRLLFKITVDSKESSKKQQAKPVIFVGVAHGAPFSRACPAKDMSVSIMCAFLRAFVKSGGTRRWRLGGGQTPRDIKITAYSATAVQLTDTRAAP